MATRAIGLDIGTFAVRAAEVSLTNSGPRVLRFGQLTLPPGAVVAGEIIDVQAVAATLRRLWERVGFRDRQVILGLANQRVLVREAEMPSMSDADLVAALQFEDAEILPVAPEEAYVDFQRLEEVIDEAGNQKVRLLLGSAQRTMVASHLEALALAGLRPLRIDPMPLALVRAIGRSGVAALEEGMAAEALVCIGAGVTTIVVHEGGVPRFTRFLSEGAAAATEAVASEMGVDLETAEDLKRRASLPGADPAAELAVSRVVVRLVDDIDSSIQFDASQHPDLPVGRVVVTGAGSRLLGLIDRLAATAGIPVEPARPTVLYPIDAHLTEEELFRAEPNLATVIGLALSAVPAGPNIRRINLLPTTEAGVREERRQILIAAAAVAGVALVLLAAWGLRNGQVGGEQSQAQSNQRQAAGLQQQVNRLNSATTATGQLSSTSQDIQTALAGDVDWASLITQVANAMPDDTWLTSFSASRGSTEEPGSVTLQVMGLGVTSAAQWITDLSQLGSLSGVWVPSISTQGSNGVATFNSDAGLGPASTAGQAARVAQYTGEGS